MKQRNSGNYIGNVKIDMGDSIYSLDVFITDKIDTNENAYGVYFRLEEDSDAQMYFKGLPDQESIRHEALHACFDAFRNIFPKELKFLKGDNSVELEESFIYYYNDIVNAILDLTRKYRKTDYPMSINMCVGNVDNLNTNARTLVKRSVSGSYLSKE